MQNYDTLATLTLSDGAIILINIPLLNKNVIKTAINLAVK